MIAALALLKKGIQICDELCLALKQEKQALIHFQIETLLENNLKKENLIKDLVETRKKLREAIRKDYGPLSGEALVSVLEDSYKTTWRDEWAKWEMAWQTTQIQCKENKRFIEHSLRNLSRFSDHLKELFGANTVYSKQGVPVDKQNEGSVVEGSY